MAASNATHSFYRSISPFRGFARLMDPLLYKPLPDDWLIGVADIVQSTQAIAGNRYKAVNMAGAAVIAAVTNARGSQDFPFVFGGDGASFAIAPDDAAAARAALAATATWVREALDLVMRVALMPVAAVRAHGHDVRIARYAPSPHVSYAMFSGGGLAWADAAMKRGEFAVEPAAAGAQPDLTGLSCRFSPIPSSRGLILSILVVPGHADPAGFRLAIEDIVSLVERSPDAGRPIPDSGPPLRWPAAGVEMEARARHGMPLIVNRAALYGWTLFVYLLMRFGISAGGFVPDVYMKQVVENSDFRKFDDGLRMVIDCTPAMADEIEAHLAAAASSGAVRYGLHRQEAAIMTCFTLAASRPDHFHFVDGAQGGYASAATALKATLKWSE
ncbi:DUF3095 domain-containing protein [Afipia sp. TerB]